MSIRQEIHILLYVGFVKLIQHPTLITNTVSKENEWSDQLLVVNFTTGHSMVSFMDGLNNCNQIKMHPHDAERLASGLPWATSIKCSCSLV